MGRFAASGLLGYEFVRGAVFHPEPRQVRLRS